MTGALTRALRAAPPLLAVALAWELAGQAQLVRPIFLPALSRVIAQAGPLWRDQAILEPLAESLFRAFAGLALALALGTAVGIAMTRRRWAGSGPCFWSLSRGRRRAAG